MKNVAFRPALVLAFALGLAACNRSKSADGTGHGEVAPAAKLSLDGFEGEIGLAVKQAKPRPGSEIPPITLQIKGDKVRADIPPALQASQPNLKGYGVLNTPEKKLYFVMDDQKQVIVLDLNQAGEQMKTVAARRAPGMGSGKPENPSKPPPTVTKTGVTDKVAGYGCQNWDVAEEKRKVATVCVADEGASWFHLPITGIPTEYAWSLELLDGKHFPLRAIGYGEDGAEEERVEVTKIEKKPLAASLFEIPPGYKVFDLMTMMQTGLGMGALMAPGMRPGMMPPGALPGFARPGGMPPAGMPANRTK
jgi:hypothetical protein